MDKKYWEIIIENSTQKLTLPFVIGSKRVLFSESKLDTIDTLLDDIVNNLNDEIFSMYYCPTIGEYVIFHNKHKKFLIKGLEVYNPINGNLKLIFGINMEIFGKTFEQIKIQLSNRYVLNLLEKKYSYENKEWKIFSEIDYQTILSFNKT